MIRVGPARLGRARLRAAASETVRARARLELERRIDGEGNDGVSVPDPTLDEKSVADPSTAGFDHDI